MEIICKVDSLRAERFSFGCDVKIMGIKYLNDEKYHFNMHI